MKNRIFFLPVSIAAFLAITAFVPSGKKIFSFVKESRPVQEGKNYYIIIDKSDYELKVYDDEGKLIATDSFDKNGLLVTPTHK